MKFMELESERLIYRKFKQEDLPVFADWRGNLENNKYRISEPRSEAETLDYLNFLISKSNEEDCTYFGFAVVLKENSTLIGAAFLYNLPDNPNFPNSPEVGWELHRDYWRQGYGTEMGKTLLMLGFGILGLRRITTCCNAKNIGSYRIMEKIGMRREAHFIKAQRGNSALNYEWCDRFQYAILQEEWIAANNGKYA